MSFVEEFVEDVKNECSKHVYCCHCRYFDDSEEECLFGDTPNKWDTECISHSFYYQFKEGENK